MLGRGDGICICCMAAVSIGEDGLPVPDDAAPGRPVVLGLGEVVAAAAAAATEAAAEAEAAAALALGEVEVSRSSEERLSQSEKVPTT